MAVNGAFAGAALFVDLDDSQPSAPCTMPLTKAVLLDCGATLPVTAGVGAAITLTKKYAIAAAEATPITTTAVFVIFGLPKLEIFYERNG
jgi:hypothetical protein